MRVLVTGCAGFIGAHVTERLMLCGHEVIGIDNLNDAYDQRLKAWRLGRLKGLSRDPVFVFYPADISTRGALDEIFRNHAIEAVVNLAARAGVRQSVLNPWIYYETNVTGTLNLLDLCRRHRIDKFVLASTSSLYAGAELPFQEDQSTDRPLSPYAASKKAAETLCFTYHRLHGLDVTVLRFFTVYGPAGRPDMGIFRFIRWIAEGEPITVYGDGSQERDFTYVGDAAQAALLGLHPLGYEVVNIGSDRPVQLGRVIAMLERLVGRRARVDYYTAHPADMTATWASIGKARHLLGWVPQTPLEDGLHAAVEWYKEHRAWASQIGLGEDLSVASRVG